MLGMLMQMLLGQTGGATGPSKNEIDDGTTASPWTNLLSVGLRVLTALLGGPQQPVDGIDKVDNQSSPMQVGEKKRVPRLAFLLFEGSPIPSPRRSVDPDWKRPIDLSRLRRTLYIESAAVSTRILHVR